MSNELSPIRTANMDKRRQRIREAARDILISQGAEALTTRRLAAAANVSAPTLYNLIGPIEDILASLIEEGVERVRDQLKEIDETLTGLELAERVVTVSVDVFGEDSKGFRAIGLAAELQSLTKGPNPAGVSVIEQCIALQEKAIRRARKSGELRSDVDARLLAEHILLGFRDPYREWSRGAILFEEFRARALHALFVCLLADASDKARPRLRKRLRDIERAIKAHLQNQHP